MSADTTTKTTADTESTDEPTDEPTHPLTGLSGFRRDLLYVVTGLDAPSGLTIKAALESYYDKSINHGRLYPNLDYLVEEGYLVKGSKDKRTNEYTLSDEGRQALHEYHRWASERVPEVDAP